MENYYSRIGRDPVPVEININKPSFWGATCRELISIRIGRWIIKNGFTPWDNMKPPLFDLEQISDNNFRLNSILILYRSIRFNAFLQLRPDSLGNT